MRTPITVEVVRAPVVNGEPETTYYRVHNPLAVPHWEQILVQLQGQCEAEIERWRDAWMRKLLPESAYKDAHSGVAKNAKRCWKYMDKERIEIVHPDGRSLERYIAVKGKIVAKFVIELFSQ